MSTSPERTDGPTGKAARDPLRVLLVEDSEDDARLVLRELRRAGYEPSSERVGSANAMRTALSANPWDIILSDYVMPGFGGLEALAIAKQSGLDLPFVLLSNKVTEEMLGDAMRAGATDFVMKDRLQRLGPVVKRELVDAAARRGLREAQIQWRDAFDSVRDAIFMHDAEFRITRANLAYAALARTPIQEVIGKLYWEVFPRRDGPLPGCAKIAKSRHGWNEEEFSLPSGEAYASRSFAVKDERGEYLYSLHVLQDVTERNRVREAVEGRERRFRALIENCADVFLLIDASAKQIFASDSIKTLTGYSPEERYGRDSLEYVFHEDLPAARQTLAEALRFPGNAVMVELRLRRKDGSQVEVEVTARNCVELPEVGGLVVIVRDISERKQAERSNLARLKRIEAHAQVLNAITSSAALASGDVEQLAREITEQVARSLHLERVNAWLFNQDESELTCIDLYEATPARHSAGTVLQEAQFQNEFLALKSAAYVDADNPLTDPRTSGYVETYLKPLGITSMLDALISVSGRHLGVLCLEQVGKPHRWEEDEITFACQLADKIALAIANRERHWRTAFFEALARSSADGILVVDGQGRKVLQNDRMVKLWKIPPEFANNTDDALQLQFLAKQTADPKAFIEKVMHLHAHPDEASVDEVATKDGAIFERYSSPVTDDNGKYYGRIWSFRDVTERKRSEETLKRLNWAMHALSQSNSALVHAATEEELYRTCCESIAGTDAYPLVWIGLAREDPAHTIEPVAAAGKATSLLEGISLSWADEVPRGRGTAGTAIRTGAIQVVGDLAAHSDNARWGERLRGAGLASAIALPILIEGKVSAVLVIYGRETDAFQKSQIDLFEELAADISYGLTTRRLRTAYDASMVERERAAEKLLGTFEGAIEALAATVEQRDPYTAGHQRRVSQLALAIGHELALDANRLTGLRIASTIHDIGKIYVPSEILSRPGRISAVEFEMIKTHAQVGYDIVKGVDFPWPVADAIHQHHERLDGSGYPQGLKGEKIILEARIIAVADVVEAMASHRPYRPGLGIDVALKEIADKRSKWFDPAVVDACLRIFRERGFAFDKS